ncbi:MAG: hypothetical protein Ta2A_07220 [Treponemataceae bacterium]|nr:MAG: hypothetical protein Ta2A_07220 [Treponemataceae bacterium]
MKKPTFALIALLSGIALAAFEWPQENVSAYSFASTFSELRGETVSTSLIFSDAMQVKAIGNGEVIAVVRKPDPDSEFFHSPLGNAIIVDHGDDIICAYANMEKIEEKIEKGSNGEKTVTVTQGDILGLSGASGWMRGETGLELQTFDLRNKKAVNPRILLPHLSAEKPISIRAASAVSSRGERYVLQNTRELQAGSYKLYKETESANTPYRTSVFINSNLAETIEYDMLTERSGDLCLRGKKYHPSREMYIKQNDGGYQRLLAEVTLSAGRNIILVTESDMNAVEYTTSYTVDVH